MRRNWGVVALDIGAGTTNVSIWHDDALVHTAVLNFGGNHITSDVAFGLRTPRAEAEKIKVMHGCAAVHEVDEEDMIEVPSVGGRPPTEHSRQFLAEIIEPRVTEILEMIREEIRKSGYQELLASGIVITGGTANMDGIIPMAEEVFNMPVRLGQPERVAGLRDMVADPALSAAVGLAKHGFLTAEESQVEQARRTHSESGFLTKIGQGMRRFASIFF